MLRPDRGGVRFVLFFFLVPVLVLVLFLAAGPRFPLPLPLPLPLLPPLEPVLLLQPRSHSQRIS